MATVTSDYVDGHSYEDVLAGFEIVRAFRVTGLVDAPERQLIEAVNDPGIPDLQTIYPGTTGILAVRRQVFPDGPNAARVIITYSAQKNVSSYNQPDPVGNDGQDVKQISAGTRSFKTQLDVGGTPMQLDPPLTPNDLTAWGPHYSFAEVLIPAGEIVFERVETSPAASRARGMVGTLNSATVGAYPAKTLLFDKLDARSNDGGTRWNCTYIFRYDLGGWKHGDSYRGPDGKVAVGAVPQSWDVIPTTNFSSLNLDFTDSQTPI